LKRLLVTDLDNTLYDWVGFFGPAFSAMVDALVELLHVDREQLLDEFKDVAGLVGSLEHPYAAFELASVRLRYPRATPAELKEALDPAFHAFNRVRKARLALFPGVHAGLSALAASGVPVVGYTESTMANAWFRLHRLGIHELFRRLYVLEGAQVVDVPGRRSTPPPPPEFIRTVPRSERKPNPALLRDIGRREGVAARAMLYVGDSPNKDVAMANRAGITAAWARYGAEPDSENWKILVRVTQWTSHEVRAAEAQQPAARPDVVLSSFLEVLPWFGIGGTATSPPPPIPI
jgi:FMN phosphatase YigB (HAD superfamily)